MATLKSIKNKYLASTDGATLGVEDNKDNIALLAFKMQATDSIAKFNMVDGFSDAYADATGVDAGNSTNENLTSNYYSGGVDPNYLGTGALGDVVLGTTSATQTNSSVDLDSVFNVGNKSTGGGTSSYGDRVPNSSDCYEANVSNTSGSYDGDMVVMNFNTLTINANCTLTTTRPCRGLFVFVKGNCEINGSLSMTARGGASNPTTSGGSDSNAVGSSGLQYGIITSGGSQSFTNDGTGFNGAGTAIRTALANQQNLSSNGTILTISKLGASGPSRAANNYPTVGVAGTTGGTTISTGSGGFSASAPAQGTYSAGDGGCFSGGSGTGGGWGSDNRSGGPGNGSTNCSGGDYGGAGGHANDKHHGGYAGWCGGGAGNPGGDSDRNQSNSYGETYNPGGDEGVGGLIWLVVGGNLTIASGGQICAKGTNGRYAHSSFAGSGSGGGAIMVAYAGTLTNNGSITAAGGAKGDQGQSSGTYGEGEAGGAGGTHTIQMSGISYQNLTLISNSVTAAAQPDTADVVATYTNGIGTATINTDLKYWVSRDNGTTYTQCTMVAGGTTGGHSILTHRGLDISGQPAGTTMRYKVTTHNQSESKETRVQAVSLAWA